MLNPPTNPIEKWTVEFDISPGRPGEAVAVLRLGNGVLGQLPETTITIDWREGMEIEDVRLWFAAQVAVSAKHLAEAMMAAV